MLLKHLGFCALPNANSGNACEPLALAVASFVTLSLLTL